MEKRETSYTVWGECKLENSMEVPQNTKRRITIWSRNPTPLNNPDKTVIQKDICTSLFIALFTIAKTRKQTKCPSIDEWMEMWFIYTLEYCSAIERNETMPSAVWMQLEIILNEVRQKDTLWCHSYMGSKIRLTWTYLWNRNTITGMENRLMVATWEGAGEGNEREDGVSRCKLLYRE